MKILFLLIPIILSCHSVNNSKSHASEKKLSYLALGDSYTIGESVAESDRFPVQFVNDFNKTKPILDQPKIIAKTGWTTDELKKGIETAQISDQKFDIVSLLIGVNNQYRGRDPEIYRQEFIALLSQSIAFANNKSENVFVVSIPDWGVTPFAKNRNQAEIAVKIDQFNAIAKEETLKKAIKFIDITPISREAKYDLTLVANDGLHPSGKMYGLWVKKISNEFTIKK